MMLESTGPSGRWWRRGLAVFTALAAVLALAAGAEAQNARPAPVGSDEFVAAAPYRGDFPDPTVVRVGSTYFAYSTTVGNLNLPTLMSTDLVTWVARSSNDPKRWWMNDSMAKAAPWAKTETKPGGRYFSQTWAPSVARLGPYFVHAYAVPLWDNSKRCISLSSSTTPTGPFTDITAGPTVCPLTEGAIDPQLFRFKGRNFMLWKTDSTSRLTVQRLNAGMSGFEPGSRPRVLLTPRLAWEGTVIENPAMIRYRKRFFLFYSANDYTLGTYATGLAVCKRITGPCKRVGKRPLLSSGYGLEGPGGATPFFDKDGRLRLAYHAWRAGKTGYPSDAKCRNTVEGCAQRRLYIATLGWKGRGKTGRPVVTSPF